MSKKQTVSLESQISALSAMKDRLSPDSFATKTVDRLHTAARSLGEIVGAKTTDTPEQKTLRLNKAGNVYLSSIGRTKDGIDASVLGGIATLNTEFAERVGLSTEGFRYTASVLDTFKKAGNGERAAMLGQIVEGGDGQSMAVLLEAPPFVHGVDREMLTRFRDVMEAKHAPDVAEKRERFKRDVEVARSALGQAERIAEHILNIESVDEALAGAEVTREAEQRLADATAA